VGTDRPQISVARPVDRVSRPWPIWPKPKTATDCTVRNVLPTFRPIIHKSKLTATTVLHVTAMKLKQNWLRMRVTNTGIML